MERYIGMDVPFTHARHRVLRIDASQARRTRSALFPMVIPRTRRVPPKGLSISSPADISGTKRGGVRTAQSEKVSGQYTEPNDRFYLLARLSNTSFVT